MKLNEEFEELEKFSSRNNYKHIDSILIQDKLTCRKVFVIFNNERLITSLAIYM